MRTAGAKRNKAEIRRDFEYLCRQWDEIRGLTLESIAPTLIFEEGGLIQRSIRDLYSREIDEIMVEGDDAYKVAKRYMKMLLPSHAKRVKHYKDPMPLFSRYKIEGFLNDILNPVVTLKSGGYLVIDTTEALVAVDVNSGRATKQASVAETALSTNLEAAEELGRQLRLRDLSGLIAIDFIDMDERRDNAKVERVLKDVVKSDRARIQIGNISGFGILEMTRQRLRPGLLESTTIPCPNCKGSGTIRTDMALGLSVLRRLSEESVRCRAGDILVATVPINIANCLVNDKRGAIVSLEAERGISVRVEVDPTISASEFMLSRRKPEAESSHRGAVEAVSFDNYHANEQQGTSDHDSDQPDAASQPKRNRRRRRKRGARGSPENRMPARAAGTETKAEDAGADTVPDSNPDVRASDSDIVSEGGDVPAKAPDTGTVQEQQAEPAGAGEAGAKGSKRQSSRRGKRRRSRKPAKASDAAGRDGDHDAGADVPPNSGLDSSSISVDSMNETTDVDQDTVVSRGRKRSNGRRRGRTGSATRPEQAASETAGTLPGEERDIVVRADSEVLRDGHVSGVADPVVDAPREESIQEKAEPSGKRRTGWWAAQDSEVSSVADK